MPVRYDEKVIVETWIEAYNGIRTTYCYHIINAANEIVVSGYTEHVIVNKETFRPLSLRKAFPDWHQAYEKHVKGERSEEHTSELQSRGHLVCRLLLEKKKKKHTPSFDI